MLQPFTDWLAVFMFTLLVFAVLSADFRTAWLFQRLTFSVVLIPCIICCASGGIQAPAMEERYRVSPSLNTLLQFLVYVYSLQPSRVILFRCHSNNVLHLLGLMFCSCLYRILIRVSFVRCFTSDTETVNRTPSGFISFYSLSCISICVARFTQRIDLGFFAIPDRRLWRFRLNFQRLIRGILLFYI